MQMGEESRPLFSWRRFLMSHIVRMLPRPINLALTVSSNSRPCKDSLVPRGSNVGVCHQSKPLPTSFRHGPRENEPRNPVTEETDMNTSRIKALLFVLAVAPLWLVPLSVARAQTPRLPDLKALDRLVGSWRVEIVSGAEEKSRAVADTKWSLQGQYIETRVTDSDGKKTALSLWAYDSDAGVYKTWFFSSNVPPTLSTLRWNESKKTFTGKGDVGNGITLQVDIHFINNDRFETTATVKGRSENVVTKWFRKK